MISLKSLTLAAVFYTSFDPSTAAHCFSIWHYKHPQLCKRGEIDKHTPENKNWYVEITKIPLTSTH